MRNTHARVARLESTFAAERQARVGSNHMLMGTIARAQIAGRPDLALVTEADTDPATYQEILEMRAWARNDYERAEALGRANRRRHKSSPSGPFASFNEAKASFVKWNNDVLMKQIDAEVKALAGAAAKARRRLGTGLRTGG